MSENNPFATPKANVDDLPTGDAVDIDTLRVSEKWKRQFHLFRRAGAPKFNRLQALPVHERKRATFSFNILAFLFGPLYYVAKGMWRRGLSLLVITVLAVLILETVFELLGWSGLGKAVGYGVAAVYALRANIDYYKKMVLRDNGWW